MNLANITTLSRILISPFICILILNGSSFKHLNLTIFLFIIAFATDWLDGFIARKIKKVTSLGKILDPVADKILVYSVIFCLIDKSLIDIWVVILLNTRDFCMSSIRTLLAKDNIIYSANILGKIKTLTQFFGILILFISRYNCNSSGGHVYHVGTSMMWISVVLAFASLIKCIIDNKHSLLKIIKE